MCIRDSFNAETLAAVQELRPLADEAAASLSQLALAWCLREPGVSSVIVGATKTSHVEDNVAAADLRVDPSVFARLDGLLRGVAHK